MQQPTNARQAGGGRPNVLLVPCWRRPEFLWHCLDNLVRAEGIRQLHVIFRPDRGYDPAVLDVIGSFAAQLGSYEVDVPVACPYPRTKQSANLLLGYLLAASRARRFVFMVEEDVMVARDFFRWHLAVQQAGAQHVGRALFCSIAVASHNRQVPGREDPRLYYLTTLDYCSWGVCFDKSVLRAYVAPHVQREYFADASGYCRDHFAHSQVGDRFVEQDGLIRRIQEAQGLHRPIAYPYRPRAFHAGFIGYHRHGSIKGGLATRIRVVGETIYDANALLAAVKHPQFFVDVPVPLETPPWETLQYEPLETSQAAAGAARAAEPGL